MKNSQDKLIRALGLGALILYGLGDILGAGIYAIIGKIAGYAGPLTWAAFTIAMGIILLTALSYSELGSRFPKSGGVSIYIHEAFGHRYLSILAGILLLSATILSMATLSQAFVGYLSALGFPVPNWLGLFGFLFILFLINFRGIKQSSIANIISTLIEVSGLLIVIGGGIWYLWKKNSTVNIPSSTLPSIKEVFQGAALAFFAFTGFEDLANVAEEVKQPRKNLPRAILYSLLIAGIFYIGVSSVATAVIPGKELSGSNAPLLNVVNQSFPHFPNFIFSFIAMFAIFNTTLLNYVTSSRLLYGMSSTKLLPPFLKTVHMRYRTPYLAILIIFPLVLGLGLIGTLRGLASLTSTVVLLVFSFSSVALIKIKLNKKNNGNSTIFQIPLWVPILAVLCNVTAIGFLWDLNIISILIIVSMGLLIFISFASKTNFSSLKHQLKTLTPSKKSIQNSTELKGLVPYLQTSALWVFDRNSVARGVAAGLAGAVIPGFQIFYAAVLVILLRGNLPIALLATLVTNPLTAIPIVYFISRVGSLIIGNGNNNIAIQHFNWDFSNFQIFWSNFSAWFLQFGKAFFIGLPIVSVCLGIIGYFGTLLIWKIYTILFNKK